MKHFLVLVGFLCIIWLSNNGYAQDLKADDSTIYVVTPKWTGWTNEDGSGFYFDLIKLIYEPEGFNIDIAFSPFARAFRMLERNKADLMFSLYRREDNSTVLTSLYPIDAGTVLIIFDRKLAWHGLSSLHNQHVIIPRGYNYTEYIDETFVTMDIVNSDQGMEMFLRGRAPYFITHYEEMLKLQKQHQIDDKLYRTEVIYRKDLHMGFANTKKGKELKLIFDNKMPELIQNNSIKKLYEKWGLVQFVNFKEKKSNKTKE